MLLKFVLAAVAPMFNDSKKYLPSSVLMVLVILVNWLWASNWFCGPAHRLRLYVVAKRDLQVNSRLEAEHVKLRLGLLRSDEPRFIRDPSLVVGTYTLRAFTAGAYISLNDVASTPDLRPPLGGAIVPVIVKAEYGRILKPGMRLMFVRNDSVVPMKRGA